MKLETTAGIMKSALDLANLVVERRNTIPVLGCVLFDGQKIVATDLDIEISIPLPATKVSDRACIALAPLLGLIRHIPADDTVKIEASDSVATISFNGGRYDLPCIPAKDFPDFDHGKDRTVVPVDDDFKAALQFVAPFISTEETRYYLNGVCLDGKSLVATDGHRLGCYPVRFNSAPFDRAILPRKAVSILTKLPTAMSISFASSNKRMGFAMGGCSITTRTIDGTFPEWQRVVPKPEPADASISVERREMMRCVRRMVALQSRGYLTLSYDSRNAVLTHKGPDGQVGREFLTCTAIRASKPGLVGFTSRYLFAAMYAFRSSERIDFIIRDSGTPVLAREKEDGPFAVVMPARGQDDKLAMDTLAEFAADLGRAA